jgi:hypothetical protein
MPMPDHDDQTTFSFDPARAQDVIYRIPGGWLAACHAGHLRRTM